MKIHNYIGKLSEKKNDTVYLKDSKMTPGKVNKSNLKIGL